MKGNSEKKISEEAKKLNSSQSDNEYKPFWPVVGLIANMSGRRIDFSLSIVKGQLVGLVPK